VADAPDPKYALFDLPRPVAGFWGLVKELDWVIQTLYPETPLREAWATFYEAAAAYAMRRSCSVNPRESQG
jgi:hypothetical protein